MVRRQIVAASLVTASGSDSVAQYYLRGASPFGFARCRSDYGRHRNVVWKNAAHPPAAGLELRMVVGNRSSGSAPASPAALIDRWPVSRHVAEWWRPPDHVAAGLDCEPRRTAWALQKSPAGPDAVKLNDLAASCHFGIGSARCDCRKNLNGSRRAPARIGSAVDCGREPYCH